MKVQIKYRDGRLDVFDTDSYTPSQPFGDGCMLANYEVPFDQLEKGLWLQAHFYETDPRFKEGSWRMTLSQSAEGPWAGAPPPR